MERVLKVCVVNNNIVKISDKSNGYVFDVFEKVKIYQEFGCNTFKDVVLKFGIKFVQIDGFMRCDLVLNYADKTIGYSLSDYE